MGKFVYEVERLPISEYIKWMAYFEIEPFGFEVENLRFGSVSASIFNARRTKRSDKHYSPNDFALKIGTQETQSMKNIMGFVGWIKQQAKKKGTHVSG